MTGAEREDRIVAGMAINVLLEAVQQAEFWFRSHGAVDGHQSMRLFAAAIRRSQRGLLAQNEQHDLALEALFVAVQLRDSAMQCGETHATLRARLTGGAEMIERLVRMRGSRDCK